MKLVASAGMLPEWCLGLAMASTRLPRGRRTSCVDCSSNHQFRGFGQCGCSRTLTGMAQELSNHRVEVTFVGPPPARQVALASGVTEVEVDGRQLRCFVCGSFQPFLEALHGSEVISLTSTRSSCR